MTKKIAGRLVIISFFSFVILCIVSFIKTQVAYSATTHLVISEVQIAGDAGANDEFIELYNPTNSSVDISTWSIQRETATETPSFVKKNFTEPAIVPSHGYYLITHNTYNGTVSADMSHGSFTISSTGGTIFLVNDNVLLTTGDEATIVDKVAIGATAYDAEETPFTPIPDVDQSIERVGDDTDNNSVDYTLQTNPNPQNSGVSPTPTSSVSPTPTESVTPTPTTEPATSGEVVINEVAWMGTQASADDEWIELYNLSDSSVDLTGWTLVATDGTPDITLEGNIPANGYFLLERSDDDTIKDITAEQIYSGALGNTGETLELRDSGNNLIDTLNSDGGGWPAGDSTARSSMERVDPTQAGNDDNWETNDGVTINGTDAADNNVLGTPKNQNSASGASPTPTPSDTVTPTLTTTPTQTPTSTPPVSPSPSPTETTTPTPTRQPTLTPTLTPSPTQTPEGNVIGKFWFPGRTVTCRLTFKIKVHRFFIMLIPKVTCE